MAEVEIRARKAGGYLMIQSEHLKSSKRDESKVFAFLIDSPIDFSLYQNLSTDGNLNIYEAYYENCQYTYILEYFVKHDSADLLREQLRKLNLAETGIYSECLLHSA